MQELVSPTKHATFLFPLFRIGEQTAPFVGHYAYIRHRDFLDIIVDCARLIPTRDKDLPIRRHYAYTWRYCYIRIVNLHAILRAFVSIKQLHSRLFPMNTRIELIISAKLNLRIRTSSAENKCSSESPSNRIVRELATTESPVATMQNISNFHVCIHVVAIDAIDFLYSLPFTKFSASVHCSSSLSLWKKEQTFRLVYEMDR